MATDELERFKKEISLADFAQAEYGYEKDVKKSSKNSLVLKAGGDEIIVTRGEDGHDIYFARGDEKDCGSVIDFVKNRVGDNNAKLVRVRQALRPWVQGAKKPAQKMPTRAPERPVAASKDLQGVLRKVEALKPYKGSYLTQERGLTAETIQAFGVQQDDRGNAVFIHKNADGVAGWESKNAGFTGFADGGSKALYMAKPGKDPVSRIVVTESAIDALSHAQMKYEKGTAYVSTAGSFSKEQEQLLKGVFTRNPEATVVLAHDNDAGGHKAAERVQALAAAGQKVVRDAPKAKDWNQALKDSVKAAEVARMRAAKAQQYDRHR